MDIGTDELLALLSDRVKAEMARAEVEQQRTSEIRWLFRQQEYLLATVREFFGEIAQRIDDLEDTILSRDERRRSLRRQLIQERKNLNQLQEEQARRGGEISIRLRNQVEETEKRVSKIRLELEQMIGTGELGCLDRNTKGRVK